MKESFPEELRISCPRCGARASLPKDIMEASYDPEVNVVLLCLVCERNYELQYC
jgi:hypothetical protein